MSNIRKQNNAEKLRTRAAEWRRSAEETALPHYAAMMLRTARQLEMQADALESRIGHGGFFLSRHA